MILGTEGAPLAAFVKNVHSIDENNRISKALVDFSNEYRPFFCKYEATRCDKAINANDSDMEDSISDSDGEELVAALSFVHKTPKNEKASTDDGGFKNNHDSTIDYHGIQSQNLEKFSIDQNKYHHDGTNEKPKVETHLGVTYHICSGWIGLGAKARVPQPSSNFLKTVIGFGSNLNLLEDLRFTTAATNKSLQIIDPVMYERYKECAESTKLPLATQAARTNDNSIWLGKAVLINEHTTWHRDYRDLPDGWCALAYFGDYANGEVCLPQLNISFAAQPRDVVLIRSCALVHFVGEWVGEGRYVIVYFTHADVFQSLNK